MPSFFLGTTAGADCCSVDVLTFKSVTRLFALNV